MKHLAIYTITYAVGCIFGWYSPNVPTVAVFGISHLLGLMMVLSFWLLERVHEMNIATAKLHADLRA